MNSKQKAKIAAKQAFYSVIATIGSGVFLTILFYIDAVTANKHDWLLFQTVSFSEMIFINPLYFLIELLPGGLDLIVTFHLDEIDVFAPFLILWPLLWALGKPRSKKIMLSIGLGGIALGFLFSIIEGTVNSIIAGLIISPYLYLITFLLLWLLPWKEIHPKKV